METVQWSMVARAVGEALEVEFACGQLMEWRDLVGRCNETGWGDDDELHSLSCAVAAAELASKWGIPVVELAEWRQRVDELEQEVDVEEPAAEAWAASAPLVVCPIPQTVVEDAESYFGGSPQGKPGVHAYCRHRLTNYDSLLRDAPSTSNGIAREVLRQRVREAIDRELHKREVVSPG